MICQIQRTLIQGFSSATSTGNPRKDGRWLIPEKVDCTIVSLDAQVRMERQVWNSRPPVYVVCCDQTRGLVARLVHVLLE